MRAVRRWVAASLLLGLAGARVAAHPATRAEHERRLDPRETARLATGRPLREATVPQSAAEGRLQIELVEAETGKRIPGLVRLTPAGGRPLPLPGLVARGLKLRAGHPGHDWHVLVEPAEVAVPRGRLRLEAFAGLETELSAVEIDLSARPDATVTVPLRRISSPASRGWHSGNTHLHLRGLTRAQADEYLQTIPAGDGVELVFVSYLERADADRDYITNVYSRSELGRLAASGVRFGWGEEHRHNFGAGGEGYGHVLFLDLRELVRPVSIGSGIAGRGPDYPPLRPGIDAARAQGATIVWCHNAFGFEHVPSWLTGRVHAQNIFDGGTQGSYTQTFYRLLNRGHRVPFSTGTDWFMYDFSRVYVQLRGPISVAGWLEGLAAGRTFITNGPLLELTAAGREIGGTVALEQPARIPVRARVVGRADFSGLELVHDGRVVATAGSRAVDGHFVAELTHELPVDYSGWVAARIPGGAVDTAGLAKLPANAPFRPKGSGHNELGEALFAHTSPIYLEVRGRTATDPAADAALAAAVEAARRTIEEKAQFADESQREEVLRIYRDAATRLQPASSP